MRSKKGFTDRHKSLSGDVLIKMRNGQYKKKKIQNSTHTRVRELRVANAGICATNSAQLRRVRGALTKTTSLNLPSTSLFFPLTVKEADRRTTYVSWDRATDANDAAFRRALSRNEWKHFRVGRTDCGRCRRDPQRANAGAMERMTWQQQREGRNDAVPH